MNLRQEKSLRISCMFGLLLFLIISCQENKSTPHKNEVYDICTTDRHMAGIKMLVYSLLINHLGRDTVFILDNNNPALNKFQDINNNIDTFWQNLPLQLDTTFENMSTVKAKYIINCLANIHFDRMVVKVINENQLQYKLGSRNNNLFLQLSDYYVFQKEGYYALAVHQISDTLNTRNYYFLSSGNNYLRYTSNAF